MILKKLSAVSTITLIITAIVCSVVLVSDVTVYASTPEETQSLPELIESLNNEPLEVSLDKINDDITKLSSGDLTPINFVRITCRAYLRLEKWIMAGVDDGDKEKFVEFTKQLDTYILEITNMEQNYISYQQEAEKAQLNVSAAMESWNIVEIPSETTEEGATFQPITDDSPNIGENIDLKPTEISTPTEVPSPTNAPTPIKDDISATPSPAAKEPDTSNTLLFVVCLVAIASLSALFFQVYTSQKALKEVKYEISKLREAHTGSSANNKDPVQLRIVASAPDAPDLIQAEPDRETEAKEHEEPDPVVTEDIPSETSRHNVIAEEDHSDINTYEPEPLPLPPEDSFETQRLNQKVDLPFSHQKQDSKINDFVSSLKEDYNRIIRDADTYRAFENKYKPKACSANITGIEMIFTINDYYENSYFWVVVPEGRQSQEVCYAVPSLRKLQVEKGGILKFKNAGLDELFVVPSDSVQLRLRLDTPAIFEYEDGRLTANKPKQKGRLI
ncbi:MAG: hypothetical protein LBQ68_06235 [Clostridiales bacterium]|jgi:hypothetical protein|nr:hypothetical protein [Clostridiales bacterium]